MDTTRLLIEERRAMRRWFRSGEEADLLAWLQAHLERESHGPDVR